MNLLRNERGGGALLYVMMISMILLVVTPAILLMTSNTSLRDSADHNSKLASNLAVSGMESFIAYLDQYTSGDRTAYVDSYPGFVSNTFTSPEGTPISFQLTKSGPVSNIYTIAMFATAGSGSQARSKTVTYTIDVSSSAGGTTITTNPAQRLAVPTSPEGIYVQGTTTGVPTSVTVTGNNSLQTAIGNTITYYENNVTTAITNYESLAATCNCNNATDITNAINASTANPVILKMANDITINSNNASLTWGSSSKPVILIFNSLTFNHKAALDLTGDLIIKNNFTSNENNSSVVINKAGSSYGNWYELGLFTANNSMSVTVPNMMYTDSMTLNNNTTMNIGKLVINNSFVVNNNATLNVASDILAGSVTVNNNSTITATAGDIFVQNNFLSNNNVNLTSGGVIAAGGNFTINGKNSTINTGGAFTSLLIDGGTTGSGGGGGTTGSGWNPTRQ